MLKPWQEETWKQLLTTWGRQPHAWLFYGPQGIAKFAFAKEYAKARLCVGDPKASPFPCGECPSCVLFERGTHPDFYLVTPENFESSSATQKLDPIKIDSIRDLRTKLQLSSYLGGAKVALLYPAHLLNPAAQNALLKILEEPPRDTVFLLVSHYPDKLLPTIRSRTQALALPAPTPEDKRAFAAIAANAQESPGESRVGAHAGSPVYQEFLALMRHPRLLKCLDFALFYDREIKNPEYFLTWFYEWLADLILTRSGWEAKFYPDFAADFAKMKYNQPIKELFDLLDLVVTARRWQDHPVNARLQIEALLLEYLLLSTE